MAGNRSLPKHIGEIKVFLEENVWAEIGFSLRFQLPNGSASKIVDIPKALSAPLTLSALLPAGIEEMFLSEIIFGTPGDGSGSTCRAIPDPATTPHPPQTFTVNTLFYYTNVGVPSVKYLAIRPSEEEVGPFEVRCIPTSTAKL